MKSRATVHSLKRGLDLLVAIAKSPEPVGITDLSVQFGLAKGSVARIVATLTAEGFVTRDPETARYRLSLKLWELANGMFSHLDVRDVARPVIEQLSRTTEETVHLTVLTDEGEMVFLDKIDSTRAVRPRVELGTHLPVHCVANGKAVLAFLTKERLDQVLRGSLRRYTDVTITRKSELLAQLKTIRRLGYAVNRGEYRVDVAGLAAPIFNHTGLPVAALGMSVPTDRMTTALIRELAPRVVLAAGQISAVLGGRPIDRRGERRAA